MCFILLWLYDKLVWFHMMPLLIFMRTDQDNFTPMSVLNFLSEITRYLTISIYNIEWIVFILPCEVYCKYVQSQSHWVLWRNTFTTRYEVHCASMKVLLPQAIDEFIFIAGVYIYLGVSHFSSLIAMWISQCTVQVTRTMRQVRVPEYNTNYLVRLTTKWGRWVFINSLWPGDAICYIKHFCQHWFS